MSLSSHHSTQRKFVRKALSARIYLSLILLGILLLSTAYTMRDTIAAALPQTAEQMVHQVWKQADKIGRYAYDSIILQTTNPAPRLDNIGRSPQTEQMTLAGQIDRRQETMHLQMQLPNQAPLEIQVIDGVASGRLSADADWQALEGEADLFASGSNLGGDPLGYLNAIKNVRVVTPAADGTATEGAVIETLFPSALLPDEIAATITRYVFDLDGPQYAAYMRRSMEEQLRRQGQLPAGIRLEMATEFIEMTGQGELWVDGSGLPMRQIIQFRLPPQRQNGDWHEVQITSTFSNWGPEPSAATLWQHPELLFSDPSAALDSLGYSSKDLQQLGYILGVLFMSIGMMALIITQRRSMFVRVPLAVSIILSMLLTPLVQAQQASAFFDTMESRRSAYAAESTAEKTITFNPLENPLKGVADQNTVTDAAGDVESTAASFDSSTLLIQTNAALAQNSAVNCTITDTSDCDGDGLTDLVEIFELGTWIDNADTDGDGISDWAEVQPYSVNGQTWYLDPRNPDTNQDGLLDLFECPQRNDMLTDGTRDASATLAACADTDGDGAPDVYDHDNDGDGVPDRVDSSPNTVRTTTDQAVALTIENLTAEKSVTVDFQIRPTNDEHLWWVNNVLNWPDNDQAGQIQRVNADTFGGGTGDMLLSPVIEIEIPFSESNRTRGLPVKAGTNVAAINVDTPIADWLDESAMTDDYGVTVAHDADTGAIRLYVPLQEVLDPVGDTPVAFMGRMRYELQSGATWGNAQNVRLLWLVTAQLDSLENGEWVSQESIIQTYYDDFIVTGMTVQENHGMDTVVIGHSPNGSAVYNRALWHVADALQNNFLGGQRLGGGIRFGVEDITGAQMAAWNIPVDALYIDSTTGMNLADDAATVKALSGDFVATTMNNIYKGVTPGRNDVVSLLFAGEEAYRAVNLADAGGAGNAIQLSFDPTVKTDVVGNINLHSYIHYDLSWHPLAIADGLATLAGDLETVFTDAQLQSMLGNETLPTDADALETVRQGAVYAAQSQYVNIRGGSGKLLVVADEVLGQVTLDNTEFQLPAQPATATVAGMLAEIQRYYAQRSLAGIALPTVESSAAASEDGQGTVSNIAWAQLAASAQAVLEGLGAIRQGAAATTYAQALLDLKGYAQTMRAADINDGQALAYVSQSVGYIITNRHLIVLDGNTNLALSYAAFNTAKAVYDAKDYVDIYRTYRAANQAIKSYDSLTDVVKGLAQLNQARSAAMKGAVIGLVFTVAYVGASVTYALATNLVEPGSPAFEDFIAQQVASLYVGALYFAIALTGVGAIVLAVLALLDALIALGCAAARAGSAEISNDVDAWVCDGVTGAFTKALTYVIHDFTPLVDLEYDNRLTMAVNSPTVAPTTGTEGLITGNQISFSAVVTSALYAGNPNWMGHLYPWQLSDDNIDDATFAYRFQENETDISLDLNGTAWLTTPGRSEDYGADSIPDGERFYQTFGPSIDYTLPAPGVNVGMDVYLSEGFNMRTQSCWLIPYPPIVVPTCWLQKWDDTFHNSLQDDFIFDILPPTLDEFRSLVVVDNVNARLAWDDSFPVLADADNDGLLSKQAGGVDPDDNTPDSDGDGLSDYFEYANNFDAQSADADCDGLTDYWEVLYGTDPAHADSDNDGLIDSIEMLHPNRLNPYKNDAANADTPTCAPDTAMQIPVVNGNYIGGWQIVYDYDANNAPLELWVNANPVQVDGDGDELTDRQEFVYGYHPEVPSSLNVLSLDTTITPSSGVAPYVKPGDTIGYSSTIGNELRNRHARGLLQAELPVDTVIQTRVFADGLLAPQESITMTGNVDVDISSSLATSMTLRAGAVIVADSDMLLHLPFNEAAGATSFRDVTVPQEDDFVCDNRGCPTANGSFAEFNNNYISSTDVNLRSWRDFTVAAWVRAADSNSTQIYVSSASFVLTASRSTGIQIQDRGRVRVQSAYPPVPEWIHVAATYNQTTNEVALYVNGLQTGTGALQLPLATPGGATIGSYGAIDDLRVYEGVLDDVSIRELAATASHEWKNESLTFDQRSSISRNASTLRPSATEFTYMVRIKPEHRPYPFDADAAAYFNGFNRGTIDHSSGGDWQGVFGYQDLSDLDRIYPSMYVSDEGRLRMVMGDGSNACVYTSPAGLVTYGKEQDVTVTYDNGTFTVYIDTERVHSQLVPDCRNVQLDQAGQRVDIGRSTALGFIHFDRVVFTCYVRDGREPRLNVNSDRTSGNIWSTDNVGFAACNDDDSTSEATIDKFITVNNAQSWFRLFDDNTGNINYNPDWDTNLLRVDGLDNKSHLGTTQTNFNKDEDGASGTLHWSGSNDYFNGEIKSFRYYAAALSENAVNLAVKTNTYALDMTLDEAPGTTIFVDSSGYNHQAFCSDDACPDSGIPGRDNQALRFDGGVADDDGNDGVADYMTLSTAEWALGIERNDYTIMAWVKPDRVDGFRRILAAGRAASANGFGFGVRDGNLLFTTFGVKDYRSTSSAIPVGTWSHVAVSFNSQNDATFYVNGELIQTVTGTASANRNLDDAYLIGATTVDGQSTTSEVWDGLIDELRIIKYAMDGDGIRAMMNEAPILNLHLDEDLGTNTFENDAPFAADATCVGASCPGAGDKGQIREAASFGGDGYYLEVADSDALDLDRFSIALWVKPSQIRSDYQPLLVKEEASAGGASRNYGLFIRRDSMGLTYSVSNCTSNTGRSSNGSLLRNQWNHVVMTYDGAAARVYINGALDDSILQVTDPCHNTAPIRIGDAIQRYTGFVGSLDEITIEQGALSAAEVAARYNYQSSWFDIKEQHPILVDADAPTVALDYTLSYVKPGQVMAIKASDTVVNGVASGIAEVNYVVTSLSGGGGQAGTVERNEDGCWCFVIPANFTGDVRISVGARDNVGHTTNPGSRILTIDTGAPSVTVDPSLLTGAVMQAGDEVTLTGTVSDGQSGVVENSVAVQLYDSQGEAVEGTVATTLAGDTWEAVQSFATTPYGAYQVQVNAEDRTGNAAAVTEQTPILLDGLAPYADMPTQSQVITQTGSTLSGVVSDVPYPVGGSRLVHLHFDEPAGSTAFVNGSIYATNDGSTAARLTATCADDRCPVAGIGSSFGNAAQFDGADDYLTMPNVLDPADSSFTAALWFNATSYGGGQRIMFAQQDQAGVGRTWLGLNEGGGLFTFLGGQGFGGGGAVIPGQWNHAAVSHDGETLRLYLNGRLVNSVARAMETSIGRFIIGAHKTTTTAFFHGAIDELVIYNQALSDAEIYNIANPLNVGVAQAQIRFRHTSGAVWPQVHPDNVALYLPLDEAAGATSYVDFSTTALRATCDSGEGTCPTAGEPGQHATALTFDGLDDFVTTPHVVDPAAGPFTAAAWFNVSSLATHRYILQHLDGAGTTGRTWLYVAPAGKLGTFLGGRGLESNATVSVNRWHHAAVSYDGATLRLYLDGALVASDTRALEHNVAEMWVGRFKGGDLYFHGAIDEVVIFDRALSTTELVALGSGVESPWSDVSLASTTSNHATWSYALNQSIEGPYKADLFVTDSVGNSRVVAEAWTGVIDTVAPRLLLDYAPDADYRNAQVRCTADDEHLVETGWRCPVDSSYRTAAYQDAAWYTDYITDTQMIIRLTTSEETVVVEPSPTMTACDLYGNCTTITADVAVLEAIAAAQGASGRAATLAATTVEAAAGTSVSVHSALQLVNTPIELSTSFAAFDAAIHTATWHWGDGSTSAATVDAASGAVSGSHAYTTADIYAAYLEVTENAGDVVAFTVPFDVVVYDPDAGKTAGGGKIDSPAGAYKLDESIGSLADFNLPVDYQKNATQPKGNFRFSLPAAGMDFVATEYEWLIVYPNGSAMAKGIGTLNGTMDDNGNPYRFWFWATDSDTDTLRVRIWAEADSQYVWWLDTGGTVIYDNGSELPINNGNVQVIGQKQSGREDDTQEAISFESTTLQHVYLPAISSHTPAAASDTSADSAAEQRQNDEAPEEPQEPAIDTEGHQIFIPVIRAED